jgi:hypothetical protein
MTPPQLEGKHSDRRGPHPDPKWLGVKVSGCGVHDVQQPLPFQATNDTFRYTEELCSVAVHYATSNDDVDINIGDTSTPTHNQISGPITQERRTGRKQSWIRAGDIRIPEQQHLVTAAPTPYGLRFWRANTFWKAIGVYFHMHQTSSLYHVGAGRNIHFSAETFSANGAATPYFGPLGRISC